MLPEMVRDLIVITILALIFLGILRWAIQRGFFML